MLASAARRTTLAALALFATACMASAATPGVGEPAPAFKLQDQDGKWHSLADYKGKWVAIYFYPKDDTPGCTKEACGFRDAWRTLLKLGVVVLGVSADGAESHRKFAAKYRLPFTLLSDCDRKVG